MIPVISDPESLTTPATNARDETGSTFDLLADRRRRIVLRYLEESDARVSMDDLADHVALEERPGESGPVADLGDALLGTRRRVRVALRHVHVPKLDAADAVDFDPDANTVSLREPGAKLLGQLDSIDE
ncbi:DUF7344 domain-containing protein [Natronococcus wangiae]|uniref:DUF7344 domain-containing protein n=1 Tax=Natronococcus wangiae TaxID=3068275 RepID=UPI00273DC20A|nr:ArsR family transcriptional regulator [Natronococcus sp. AD5]